jgi:hypothetical protein
VQIELLAPVAASAITSLSWHFSALDSHPLVVLISVRRNRDGLTIETALTAAELSTIGLWQRIDGGYRVLDWEAVEFCLDLARQRAGEDTQDLAAEHDREALVQMNQPMIITPPCGPCRTYLPALSSSPPDTCRPNAANGPAPSKTASNSNSSQEAVVPAVKGVATDNGYGRPINTQAAPDGSRGPSGLP